MASDKLLYSDVDNNISTVKIKATLITNKIKVNIYRYTHETYDTCRSAARSVVPWPLYCQNVWERELPPFVKVEPVQVLQIFIHKHIECLLQPQHSYNFLPCVRIHRFESVSQVLFEISISSSASASHIQRPTYIFLSVREQSIDLFAVSSQKFPLLWATKHFKSHKTRSTYLSTLVLPISSLSNITGLLLQCK